MRFLIPIFLCFVSGIAQAQDAICQRLSAYQQPAGVEYKPDHEVPADLNPLNASPGVVLIPIEVNLAERYGFDVPDDALLRPVVSSVSVFPNGRVEYNGQDVTQRFEEICESDVQVDGQKADDALSSEPRESKVFEVRKGIEGEILEGQYPVD